MLHHLTFDELPDDAFVRVPTAQAICAKSRSALYAEAAAGSFPRIQKIGCGRSSGVRAGDLRRYLKNPAAFKPTTA